MHVQRNPPVPWQNDPMTATATQPEKVELEASQLPAGWVPTTAAHLGELIRGVTYNKSQVMNSESENALPILRANNIQSQIETSNLVYIDSICIEGKQVLKQGDVVIAMSNGSINLVGKTAQMTHDFNGGFGAFCAVFRPINSINHLFVGYFFKSPFYRQVISSLAKGSNINNLKREHVENLSLPLPPLPEQRRIVTKIEELFSKLDAGVTELKRTRALLKRYRQSVLHAAVTGELSRGWREVQGDELEDARHLLAHLLDERRARWAASGKKGKYAEPQGPDVAGLPELPGGWVWASVEQIGEVTGGLTKNAKRDGLPTKIPYLRVANVYSNELKLNEIENIGIAPNELARVLLLKNDLLIVEGNGSPDQIGRLAIWNGSIEPCAHQNHLIKLRLGENSLSEWPMYWFISPTGRERIKAVANSTSGLYTLSISKIEGLPLPLPSRSEQSYIVSEVERRLSILANVEATVAAELKRAESTRRGILRRAFAGQLVPQDAADEPASVLLERIQAERLAAGAAAVRATGKRGRKPKQHGEQVLLAE